MRGWSSSRTRGPRWPFRSTCCWSTRNRATSCCPSSGTPTTSSCCQAKSAASASPTRARRAAGRCGSRRRPGTCRARRSSPVTPATREGARRSGLSEAEKGGTVSATAPGLRRTLTLWDAVFYGIVLVQPVAPMGIFGVVSQEARGHVITTILIGMFAMLLTAMSYGRMARVYPSAGSAFAYVGQELHPGLGYVTGWSMVMDYVLNPMICTIYCSKVAMTFIPGVPYTAWVAVVRRGVHDAEPPRRESQCADQRSARCRHVRRRGALRRRRTPLPVCGRSQPGGLRPAVLRSADLRAARRPDRRVDRVPDLHRLRRHLDSLGGSREPEAEYPARDGTHVPDYRRAGVDPGVSGAARLGELDRLSRRGHGVRARRGKGRRPLAVCAREPDAARREPGIGHERASWRRPAALWHGTQRRTATPVLRRRGREKPDPAEQRAARGRARFCRRPVAQLSARRRAPELRRVHRLHGRQPRGVRPLLGAERRPAR